MRKLLSLTSLCAFNSFPYFMLFIYYRFPEVDQETWAILSNTILFHCYHVVVAPPHTHTQNNTRCKDKQLAFYHMQGIIHHKNKQVTAKQTFMPSREHRLWNQTRGGIPAHSLEQCFFEQAPNLSFAQHQFPHLSKGVHTNK